MAKTWLVLDCNYLCHRAFHTTGALSHKHMFTGVTYGFLRDIANFQDKFNTANVAFCFDHGKCLREQIFPGYKYKRRNRNYLTPEEAKTATGLKEQIKLLKEEYLKELGFRNIFYQQGFEADDIIARFCQKRESNLKGEYIIVAADKDFYQLLAPNISMWDPRTQKMTTEDSFTAQYKITPSMWIMVKSLAGCKSDDIPGVPRIGEETALKYLRGDLSKTTVAHKNITSGNFADLIETNISLVTLPYKGVAKLECQEDEVTKEHWLALCDRLGIKSLRNKPPIASRGFRHSQLFVGE